MIRLVFDVQSYKFFCLPRDLNRDFPLRQPTILPHPCCCPLFCQIRIPTWCFTLLWHVEWRVLLESFSHGNCDQLGCFSISAIRPGSHEDLQFCSCQIFHQFPSSHVDVETCSTYIVDYHAFCFVGENKTISAESLFADTRLVETGGHLALRVLNLNSYDHSALGTIVRPRLGYFDYRFRCHFWVPGGFSSLSSLIMTRQVIVEEVSL